MDFLALPRRDLQALCKRNGVRANMTNAAMADALRALPKIEGIEEYVKVLQPVAVPQTAVKSVNEEQKQESPRPRGRRAMAESSEPIELAEDKEKLEGDAKRQSNKEDAQAPGVGRRGASRREDSQGQEDMKREAKRDNVPAPGVERRGASRRARPSPAVAPPPTDESEVAGAEVEQSEEVVVEDPKREVGMDDARALGVGRRGASRRARPSPSVAALASKVVAEEEQRAQIPLGHHVKAKGSSTEPIRLDDSDDEEQEDAKPEEEQEDAQILGVGLRGGAGRRAQVAPAVAAPEAKAEEEQRAPVSRGHRATAKSTELIMLDDNKEEKKEDMKPEEERGDAPAIVLGRRGASRRAPAPSEAPATRRSSAASKTEDVAVEVVPIRATRQRKPTLKAGATAAAAEEKAPRRTTRRGAVTSTLWQQEVQEEPQEAVGAPNVAVEAVPIRATRQRKPTMKAAASPTVEEKAPPRATRRGAVMRTLSQQEVQEELQEAVCAPVSYQRCDAVEELEEASNPHKEELNDVDAPKQEEDEDVVIIEDEKLMEETPAEEPSVIDQECMDKSDTQEQQVDDDKCHAALATQEESRILGFVSTVNGDPGKQVEDEDVIIMEAEKLMEETPAEEPSLTDQECMDKSKMQEQQVDDGKCHAALATQEESRILGLVSTVTVQASEDDEGASFHDVGGFSSGLLNKAVCKETCDAGEQMELVPPLTASESATNHESESESEIGTFNEVPSVREDISEVDTKDDEVCTEKEHMDIAELQADIVDEADFLDCSGQLAGEETNEEVIIEDGLGCQKEGDVVVDKVLHDSVDDTVLLDCPRYINWVEMEKAGNIISEMPQNQAALDEDGEKTTFYINICDADKPNEVVVGDSMSQVTVTHEDVQEEKGVLITDEMLQGTAGMHGYMDDDQFETVFVQADQVVTADNLPGQVTDSEITVEANTSLIVDERQQSTVTMDEDVVEDHSETDGVHSNEQIEVVTTDKVPELKLMEDVLVQADQVVAADNLPEQVTDYEITVEENTVLIVDENQQSIVTMDEDADEQTEVEVPEQVIGQKTPLGVDEKQQSIVTMDEDVVDDHSKTDVVHANEQMEVVTTDEVPELTQTDDEVVEMKTPLVVHEKQQSTITNNGDIVDDHFKTHVGHADEQKEVVATEVPEVTGTDFVIEKTPLIVTEVPDEVTGTDDEVVEEKAVVITENMLNQGAVPNYTHPMDECLNENHFGTDFGHGNEQKAITGSIEPKVSRAQHGGAQKENGLFDDVAESLSKSIITMEPSVCKNSSEKNTAESMAVLEEKRVKLASESEDLYKLSLGQLRAKLKEKLNAKKNKEAKKRVALARVDENVCRSHSKGQQQNLNLQQH